MAVRRAVLATPRSTGPTPWPPTRDEIRELLLQTGLGCGAPGANAAFRVAQEVLDESEPPTP